MSKHRQTIRGAEDLAALWGSLPVAARYFSCGALPAGIGMLALNGKLRSRIFRAMCASAGNSACIAEHETEPRRCQQPHVCHANALFPLGGKSGGEKQWRMATLRLNWYPKSGALWLLALGKGACEELDWAATEVGTMLGQDRPVSANISSFSDLVPQQTGLWRIEIVTPWVIDKQRMGAMPPSLPDASSVFRRLFDSLSARAHKISALCSTEERWQRIAGHLSRYVTQAILSTDIELLDVSLSPALVSVEREYDYVCLTGHFVMSVSDAALPWLGLLATCGIGENADHGFGQVEITPIG